MRPRIIRGLLVLIITLSVMIASSTSAAPGDQNCPNGAVDPSTAFQEGSAACRSKGMGEETGTLNPAEVRALVESNGNAAPNVLFGTGYTYRHDWGNKRGQWKLTLTSPSITARSRVFVSIGETAQDGSKFVGAARYTVHNVAPRNGAVTIWVNIQWNRPLHTTADYLIINP